MKVKALREQLLKFHTVEADVKVLACLLEPVDELPVDELTKAIRPVIDKLAKKAASEKKKRETFNTAAIDRYLSELSTSKDDNAAFEAIVKRIEKDRSLKIGDAKEIARGYLGELPKVKSKGEILKAILQRQIADRRLLARRDQVSDLF